jgi:hypothetical protein
MLKSADLHSFVTNRLKASCGFWETRKWANNGRDFFYVVRAHNWATLFLEDINIGASAADL